MAALALTVRWLHLAAACSLVGTFAFAVLMPRPATGSVGIGGGPLLAVLDRRLARLGAAALAVTLATGLLDLWRQVTVATGAGLAASLMPDTFLAVLADTRYGIVWLARAGLLALLGVFLFLTDDDRRDADRTAGRLQALVLAAAALALLAGAGHAAAAQPVPAVAIAADALHLVATGAWAGALVPLLLCLGATLGLPAADAAPLAAGAARRFSAIGVLAVFLLIVTGAYAAWVEIGGVPALVGTSYGRWLLVKLLLFATLLTVAARNLLVWRQRLAAAGSGPATVRALSRLVCVEVGLATLIIGIGAVLGLTTPALHDEAVWPFSFRFDWAATKDLPGVRSRVAIGSQVATLGLVALLLALIVRPRRWRVAALASALGVILGVTIALPSLSVDANPTTYFRPAVPYTATSIDQGRHHYHDLCQSCHGPSGYGDGPAAGGLPRAPADLTARHAADHTAGDLFWWVTHGIPRSAMPGFADRLPAEARWDVINFVRALGAAEQARDLGPIVTSRPGPVAPDFAYSTGVGEGRALRDARGQAIVLLVFFSLPRSIDRLVQLNRIYPSIRLLGAEVLGVPAVADSHLYRSLGARPVFFPLAVEGAADAVAAYRLFRRDLTPEGGRTDATMPAHMELLVDRQGYLRGRFIPAESSSSSGGWNDPARLLGEIQRLARETPVAPVAADHVH